MRKLTVHWPLGLGSVKVATPVAGFTLGAGGCGQVELSIENVLPAGYWLRVPKGAVMVAPGAPVAVRSTASMIAVVLLSVLSAGFESLLAPAVDVTVTAVCGVLLPPAVPGTG